MERRELAGSLHQPFTTGRGFGVEKVEKAGFENIWSVVPPPPPRRLVETPDLKLLRDVLTGREAVSSSRMEGTWSTIDEVLSPAAADSGRTASVSVRGYANALVHAFQVIERQGLDALSPELLCELHEWFMEKDPHFRGVAGRLRAPGLPGDVVQIGSFRS